MAHDVFISYSRQDKTIADAACAKLEGQQVRCWISPRDQMASTIWTEELAKALCQSRIMLVVLSRSSNESDHVKREVNLAVKEGIIIIPFRIEDVDLSPGLEYLVGNIHWLDAMTPPLESHLDELAQTVCALMKTAAGQPRMSGEQPAPRTSASASSKPAPAKRGAARGRSWRVLAALGAVSLLVAAGLVFLFLGGRLTPRIDFCDPNLPPPVYEPGWPPAEPATPKPGQPLLPPDPKHTLCGVSLRNETGKPLRIWRFVHRPEDDHDFARWRTWMACKNLPDPPPSIAGWTYFVVEDPSLNVGKTESPDCYVVGWRFLAYGGFATIRIKPNFLEAPDSAETFVIDYAN